ncbi:tyrosine-type recombinase/integrase [Flavobacterium sp.]|uniref:tyrosine-type recombinase/integrase n=1 Tax=Flavobacterium sp. TaxID=239 RepID=UPI003D2A27D6
MSKYFLFLQTVHDTVHDLGYNAIQKSMIKSNFSTPKIFTGGVDINDWKKLSPQDKKRALSKDWYIYYSFRDKETGKLKRMPNVKGGVNRLKTMSERMSYLKIMSDSLLYLLEKGLNPYEQNDLTCLNEKPKADSKIKKPIEVEKTIQIKESKVVATDCNEDQPNDFTSIKEALDFALEMKKGVLSANSFKNFELRIRKYRRSLNEDLPISSITKKSVNDFLNDVLVKTSARTRNNTRVDLSSLFQVLEDNEMIATNFIKSISLLKTVPERNKTYTPTMQNDIFNYLEESDPLLLLFIKFVSYNFLRPVEVCRLKVRDIDVKDKKLYIKAKNKAVKIKIIPEKLIKELPDLTKLNQDNYLFTPIGYGLEWEATENNRRDHFTKRFKEVVKDQFKLGPDYGLYSFRHTFITKLYRNIREESTQFEAKSILMGITGHTTMTALEKYLRDIDAELPEDYSKLLI